ncbi:consortin, connexin sorting protein b isoform X1 [Pangasianodon hypophthalmus]|uniref:consortin, connexin sorting protein b isoform X1 n=1 Tax=Pangasianodon hypophthalmus TaxID=310915 RepID=UPI00230710E5|nr:consortin, connexin sorting protein b isoform X1 [Pangasianodon hypophthalmus]
MGDPKTEEDMRGQEDHITLWPNGTEAIISSDLSVSHENQNKSMMRETMDWPLEKQHMMNNKPEEKSENNTIRFSLDGSASGNLHSATGPSPAFLAALASLGEHTDHMLLPHSLHQIAEAYFLEEDYQWAVHFLHLEMLYHERLLSNLASMQKAWESRWKAVSQAKNGSPVKIHYTEPEAKHMNSLNLICRSHQRPNRSGEKQVTKESITVQYSSSTGNPFKMKEWTEQPWSDPEEENGGEEEDREAESLTEVVQEAVARRQQLSGEELTEPIEVEETFPSNGLISILKKRTCPEESSPVNHSPPRTSSKFKVRFSETDALLDNDEEGEDSCLFLLFLCLVTVVISMGGTMLYCFLGGAYSNICTDFSHNMDFCSGFIRRVVDILTHWFIPASS